MPTERTKLGILSLLNTGMARKAGEEALKTDKKKKKKLDEIVGSIRSTRKQ